MQILEPSPYCITGADGGFSFRGLPPGEPTIEFIHERLGALARAASIGAGRTRRIDLRIP